MSNSHSITMRRNIDPKQSKHGFLTQFFPCIPVILSVLHLSDNKVPATSANLMTGDLQGGRKAPRKNQTRRENGKTIKANPSLSRITALGVRSRIVYADADVQSRELSRLFFRYPYRIKT
jgi:hypothetical protein